MSSEVVTEMFDVYGEITTNETLMRRATVQSHRLSYTLVLSLLDSEGIAIYYSSLTTIPPTSQIKRYISMKRSFCELLTDTAATCTSCTPTVRARGGCNNIYRGVHWLGLGLG